MMQIEALNAAGCDRIYHEKKSGAKADRPELRRALEFLRSGDTLVVWKLSRLARGLDQLLKTHRLLTEAGVELVSLTEKLDTTNPYGRAQFQFIGVLDELQREIIRENTIEGLAVAKANGRRPGRRPKPISSDQLEIARTLMRAGNVSMPTIAAQIGISKTRLYELFPGGRAALVSDE